MPDDRPEKPSPALARIEETAAVGKKGVVTGKVRVRTETDTVERVALGHAMRVNVEVTRVPVHIVVTETPPIRTEGDVTVLSVIEEEFVVEKRLVVVEEIHLRRLVTRHALEVPVTLRRQRAVVERLDPETGSVLSSPVSFEEKD